jgi:hypothetical protein
VGRAVTTGRPSAKRQNDSRVVPRRTPPARNGENFSGPAKGSARSPVVGSVQHTIHQPILIKPAQDEIISVSALFWTFHQAVAQQPIRAEALKLIAVWQRYFRPAPMTFGHEF